MNENLPETSPADRFKAALATPIIQQQFQNALAKNANAFTASLLDAYVSELFKYDPFEIIGEAIKAAVLNLPIAKSLGFAYLVPYKGKIQFQLGYKGLIQLAMRSGQVKTINAGPVFEGEWRSTDKLRGTYDLSGEKISNDVVGYFTYMELINGFEKTVYWTKEDVIKHATAKSPSYKNQKSAWFTDFDAMAIKTTIRALFGKYAPMSVDFQRAIEYDEPDVISGSVAQEPDDASFKEIPQPGKEPAQSSGDAPEPEPEIGDPFGENE